MRRSLLLTAGAFALVAASGAVANAQGTLSTQGFGYPPGQLSTRALSTGGGLGQFDPDSPLNPAAISTSSDARVFFQYEPEFRRLTMTGAKANTTTSRFPLTSASIPIGSRASAGLSVSTYLDRSSATTSTREARISDQDVTVFEAVRMLGAINDVRLAFGWGASRKLQIGAGAHVFTGQNRVFFSQTFPDSLKFTPVVQSTTLGFTGFGVSAGAIVRPSPVLALALSGRKGGGLRAKVNDSTVSEANVPDRYSAGLSYEGITGASISAQVSRETWSAMNGLGTDAATAADAWEGGFGIETAGPRIAERLIVFRAGTRYRTLPFQAAGSKVDELSFVGGVGAQFFRNRAAFDMALQYSTRSAEAAALSEARERSFILSFGLRVRP